MIHTPTLARDGFALQADGWEGMPRVPLSIQGERLVCAACRVRRSTRVYVVCRSDRFLEGAMMAERLGQWGYRKVRLETQPPPPPEWFEVGYCPD